MNHWENAKSKAEALREEYDLLKSTLHTEMDAKQAVAIVMLVGACIAGVWKSAVEIDHELRKVASIKTWIKIRGGSLTGDRSAGFEVTFDGLVEPENITQAIEKLGTLKNVSSFTIRNNANVKDDIVKQLASFPDLTNLSFVDCPELTDTTFEILESSVLKNSLTKITVDGCRFSGHGLKRLARFPRIDSISANWCLQKTRDGVLPGIKDGDQLIQALCHTDAATRRNLRVLELRGAQLSIEGGMLQHLSNLEELRLSRNRIDPAGVGSLAELTRLRKLSLSDMNDPHDDLGESDRQGNVAPESTCGNETRTTGIESLSKLKNLTNLSLSNSGICQDELRQLLGVVDTSQYSQEEKLPQLKLPHLNEIIVAGNDLSKEFLIDLRKQAPSLRTSG